MVLAVICQLEQPRFMTNRFAEDSAEAKRRADARTRLRASDRHTALESLIRLIEHELPSMRGSVLILDPAAGTLRHCAAPSLAQEYARMIDGQRIGPMAGSCGTAAYLDKQIIVSDIAADPLWERYRDFALPFGLRACWSTPIRDELGQLVGTFAMYYDEPRSPSDHELDMTRTATMLAADIIVRARAEAELVESEERMRAARAEAERANESQLALIATLSHELRTPLNAVGGYASLMLDVIQEPVSESHSSYLRRILAGQDHLIGLIDALLTLAKLESGTLDFEVEDVSVGDVLGTIEALSRPQRAARGLRYDCSRCDEKLVLRADRQKTVQILLNLISNALKFTPRGGSITVRTDVASQGMVLLAVRDTGIGMTAEVCSMIFEPYVHFDHGGAVNEAGTGLGLAISRRLARGMGGDLTVESEPGVGTEFLLTLLPAS
jgi:two-component system cell cycle sensor histidine kinase PleC